jgi:hypothetical protein
MTWTHRCPNCLRASVRHCPLDRKPICAHLYHDANDCDLCGDCRTGWINAEPLEAICQDGNIVHLDDVKAPESC